MIYLLNSKDIGMPANGLEDCPIASAVDAGSEKNQKHLMNCSSDEFDSSYSSSDSENHENSERFKETNKKMSTLNFVTHPNKEAHETFIKTCMDVILKNAVFEGTDRRSKVVDWIDPQELERSFDFQIKDTAESQEGLLNLIKETIKYSVKTGHPYFINQLYSSVDPYALVGQWLTDSLNPSVYTYEVSPVFICMEETVLAEMRKIVGFENWKDGDGIFCPGGSIANGYGISCARFKAIPDIKVSFRNFLLKCNFLANKAHFSLISLSGALELICF